MELDEESSLHEYNEKRMSDFHNIRIMHDSFKGFYSFLTLSFNT